MASPPTTTNRSVIVSILPQPNAATGAYVDDALDAGEGIMYDVDPRIWGRYMWADIHLTAYAYPDEPTEYTRQAIFAKFDAMRFTLPCGACREHYREVWTRYPIERYLESRALLIEWSILVHDAINESIGLPPFDYKTYLNALTGTDAVTTTATSSDDDDTKDDDDEDEKSDEDDDDDNEKPNGRTGGAGGTGNGAGRGGGGADGDDDGGRSGDDGSRSGDKGNDTNHDSVSNEQHSGRQQQQQHQDPILSNRAQSYIVSRARARQYQATKSGPPTQQQTQPMHSARFGQTFLPVQVVHDAQGKQAKQAKQTKQAVAQAHQKQPFDASTLQHVHRLQQQMQRRAVEQQRVYQQIADKNRSKSPPPQVAQHAMQRGAGGGVAAANNKFGLSRPQQVLHQRGKASPASSASSVFEYSASSVVMAASAAASRRADALRHARFRKPPPDCPNCNKRKMTASVF